MNLGANKQIARFDVTMHSCPAEKLAHFVIIIRINQLSHKKAIL